MVSVLAQFNNNNNTSD